MHSTELGRAADTAVSLVRDLADTGCWATLARLGQTLSCDSPITRVPEPDEGTERSLPRWRRRFVRLGRQSSGSEGRAHGARWPELTAEARFVDTSAVLTRPP